MNQLNNNNIRIESTGSGYRVKLESKQEEYTSDWAAIGIVIFGLSVIGVIANSFFS